MGEREPMKIIKFVLLFVVVTFALVGCGEDQGAQQNGSTSAEGLVPGETSISNS
jgi:hypothetical protein